MNRYRINLDFPRPDPELVERAANLIVTVVATRVGPRQIVDAAIKPLVREWRVCGPAFTIRPEVNDDRLVAQLAPKYAKPGDVLVIDAAGRTDSAVWGSGMTTGAQRAGCAGVVVDGMIETWDRLANEFKVPVFARGLYPLAAGRAESPGWLNVPVICGGVIVYPGDLILGNYDGIVVVPRSWLPEIVRISEERVAYLLASRKIERPPYWEITDSEAKLRAMPGIEWATDPEHDPRL